MISLFGERHPKQRCSPAPAVHPEDWKTLPTHKSQVAYGHGTNKDFSAVFKNEDYCIEVDDLPEVPGLHLTVISVY